jgi:hypothetical protein
VAQLIARSVWDREVEGLSPFTPTKKKSVHLDGFFLVCGYKPQTFDPNFALKNLQVEVWHSEAQEKKAPKAFSFPGERRWHRPLSFHTIYNLF